MCQIANTLTAITNPITKRLIKLYLDELEHGWSQSHEEHSGLLHIGDCNRDEVKKDIAATLNGYDEFVRLRNDMYEGILGIENESDSDAYYAFERLIDERLCKYEREVAQIVITSIEENVQSCINTYQND